MGSDLPKMGGEEKRKKTEEGREEWRGKSAKSLSPPIGNAFPDFLSFLLQGNSRSVNIPPRFAMAAAHQFIYSPRPSQLQAPDRKVRLNSPHKKLSRARAPLNEASKKLKGCENFEMSQKFHPVGQGRQTDSR